ncbi:MAG: hypothetical protein Ct9H300mP28_24620 [Pseudomonadota bacterium]|nr:MAG: hypothetical protein Ct9H300mP28_24620 [Pseudomonadota bacterium]
MPIVTGTEPEIHGISGNFFLDPETQEPVVMTGPELLRSRSIMSEFSREGPRVVSITEKGTNLGNNCRKIWTYQVVQKFFPPGEKKCGKKKFGRQKGWGEREIWSFPFFNGKKFGSVSFSL